MSSRYPGKKTFSLWRYYIKGSMDEETTQSRTFSKVRDSPHFLYVRDTSSRLKPRYHQQACRGSSIASRSSLKGCEDCLVCHRLQEPWLGCWVLLTTIKLLRRKSSSYEINRSAYISRKVGEISLDTALKKYKLPSLKPLLSGEFAGILPNRTRKQKKNLIDSRSTGD